MISVVSLLIASTLAFQPEITPELRGDVMMARKMYREAIDYYKPGSANNAVLANKTGIAYQQLADLDKARTYYQRAIKLNPAYAEAINNLGTVYYARKSYGQAIKQYKKAVRLMPNSAVFQSNLGYGYLGRKQDDLAFQTFQLALALDPAIFQYQGANGVVVQDRTVEERAKYNYLLAKTYARAGVAEEALQSIRRALEQGFKDRQKFLEEPEFAFLKDNAEFQQILATEYKTL